jgi:putative oxidoreductase
MAEQTYVQAPVVARVSPDWLLRIALASVFIFHGASKAQGLMAGGPVPMGHSFEVWALVALAEVAGGLGILLGGLLSGAIGDAITRLSGLAIVPVMLGAIVMVHWGRWNFVPSDTHPMGGMEFQVVLVLIGLFFVLRGNRA